MTPRATVGTPPNAWTVDEGTVDISRPALPPRVCSLETETKQLTLDLAKAVLIVVDMQNDFCHADGWLASVGADVARAREPIAPLVRLLPALRAADVPVLWLNMGHRPDLRNVSACLSHVYSSGTRPGLGDALPPRGGRTLVAGSWGAALVEELAAIAAPDDLRVDKYQMSGFWDTPLESVLRTTGRSTLFFAGVNADQCVLTTLQDASFLGFDCILLCDCTATSSPDFCMQATLYNVSQCFGFVSASHHLLPALAAVVATRPDEAPTQCAPEASGAGGRAKRSRAGASK
ncbi:hypothetical protein KFE25_005617 [Diacronema lutheri]|uniref:Isochorismatase-like domain-containing protein n=2 Tax=Diacronema lutheri TaxID=2081491 RepID=A0A8J5XKC7_DIALT|nr:hypothetical protein KFE25_005617 [Diacronema lutheri]